MANWYTSPSKSFPDKRYLFQNVLLKIRFNVIIFVCILMMVA
ncbi:hypothetical protein TREPR_2246 [Treponema primitia ZAS-2]|uniref:Uncharacterized protein n=1 Tax=Treponema primitia (strain ATCC BAA-887 / DSM 12427 / ZAS-2) TaxID=545694 RepID=F5YIF7_TREPZ|nr:hypothetical protein TREPR_2246 [Treponema primitia ZAS-2]